MGARLKEPAPFYEVYADRACQEQVSALAQRLAELVHAEERMRLEQTGREAPPIGDVMAARLPALRDILWSLVARARRKGRLSCCKDVLMAGEEVLHGLRHAKLDIHQAAVAQHHDKETQAAGRLPHPYRSE